LIAAGGAVRAGRSASQPAVAANTLAGWSSCSLADCVDLTSGFAFKSEHFSESPRDGVALVKGENVSQGRILWSISKFWPENEWAEYERVQLRSGDVVVAMDRPWVPAGLKWAFIRDNDPKALLVQRCARLRSKAENLEQGFLRFVIGSPDFENYIRPIVTGVNVPHISGTQILAHRFLLPPVAQQRRIAGILSAYDDLIENCERRIRVLDEMARALYREWFVLFRYPGHEKTPLVDSALGRIPKGWKRGPIKEIYAGLFDGPHATPAPANEGPVFLGIGNMTESGRLDLSSVRHIAEADFDRWTKRVTPQAGDIVFTYEATLHRYALIPDDFRGCLGRRLALIRVDPSKKCGRFLFFTLLSDAWHEVVSKNTLSGATVDRVPLSKLPEFPIILPPMPLVAQFDDAVLPIVDDQTRLSKLIINLRRTRDLLLPRLLSGQLSVEDAA